MTFTHSGVRTFTIAAAFALVTSVTASSQTPVTPPHKYGSLPHAAPTVDLAAKLASLDARIAVLRADMMMFVGELKIQVMASLLDALVERQALTDQLMRMRRMPERIRDRMKDRSTQDQPAGPSSEVFKMEAEMMCPPYI